jgi:NADH dehydrogenase
MTITTVCVIGGSGFIGRQICGALAAQGYRVRVPTRDRERAKRLILLPTVDAVVADVHDPAALAGLVQGTDAVINLVGVLHGGSGNKSFQAAHVELARKVVAACRSTNVRRLLHMSALNAATDAPSDYLRTKGEAENIVRASGLDATIFRPAVVFGPEDVFLNRFAALLKLGPMLVIPCPRARFQPVYVGDVAQAFVSALSRLDAYGRSYDLCGPKIYTMRELIEFVARVTDVRRLLINADQTLSVVMATVMEFLPGKMMSRDNVRSMQVDCVCDSAFPFGVTPGALEALAPMWLAQRTSRDRYMRLRGRAGR